MEDARLGPPPKTPIYFFGSAIDVALVTTTVLNSSSSGTVLVNDNDPDASYIGQLSRVKSPFNSGVSVTTDPIITPIGGTTTRNNTPGDSFIFPYIGELSVHPHGYEKSDRPKGPLSQSEVSTARKLQGHSRHH